MNDEVVVFSDCLFTCDAVLKEQYTFTGRNSNNSKVRHALLCCAKIVCTVLLGFTLLPFQCSSLFFSGVGDTIALVSQRLPSYLTKIL